MAMKENGGGTKTYQQWETEREKKREKNEN